MRFIPARHRVLVRPERVEEKTRGGLYVPEHTRERQQAASIRGELVAAGPNAWKAFDDGRPWADVGDTVIFAKYGGFEVEDEETKTEYRLLNDEDIIAKIER